MRISAKLRRYLRQIEAMQVDLALEVTCRPEAKPLLSMVQAADLHLHSAKKALSEAERAAEEEETFDPRQG